MFRLAFGISLFGVLVWLLGRVIRWFLVTTAAIVIGVLCFIIVVELMRTIQFV